MLKELTNNDYEGELVSPLFSPANGGTIQYLQDKYQNYRRARGLRGFMKHLYLVMISMFYQPRSDMNQFEDRNKQDNLNGNLAKKLGDRILEMSPDLQDKLEGLAREHRLEYLGTKDGVRYINDAAATSANALWFALSETDGPIVLIAGNPVDPKGDWAWVDLYNEKVRFTALLSESRVMDGMKVCQLVKSLEEAVVVAHNEAKKLEGATVLFSPGCPTEDIDNPGYIFKNEYRRL